MKMRFSSAAAFAALCAITAAALGLYIGLSRHEPAAPALTAGEPRDLRAVREPTIVFRHTEPGDRYGHLAFAPIRDANLRTYASFSCERVDFAADRGVCLTTREGFGAKYRAVIFDATFAIHGGIDIPGLPSRVRLSPDGTRAGVTVFVTGDSYADSSGFSTRTFVLDVPHAAIVNTLEDYAISKSGRSFRALDFNFWGLTFVDSRNAYATLATGGRTHLVRLDLAGRSGQVVVEDVECPALSPDATRVAFKRRVITQGKLVFRLSVLTLATLQTTELAEPRSVDDQPAWLDGEHVIYGLPRSQTVGVTDVWTIAADGRGEPQRLVSGAWSPSVVVR